jgi:two-component system response regulator AtoC
VTIVADLCYSSVILRPHLLGRLAFNLQDGQGRLAQSIERSMPISRATEQIDIRSLPPVDLIFGRSPAMTSARDQLERVAKTTIPVLLQGESGTGKDILAKLLHIHSNRASSPWVKVTCPAIPNALIESELFGYEKGAFTGAYATKRGRVELAHQGTLFLDELGSLENSAQAKLLQVLQDGTFMRVGAQESRKVDTRLVCAANGDLRRQTAEGSFRLDLFFRISAVTIHLTPLRQRITDLPMLIDYFFDLHSTKFRLKPKPLSHEAMAMMQRYHWPGNIRQLENVILSYVLIGNEETLAAELLPSRSSEILPQIDLSNPISLKEITKAATQQLERQIILKVLHAHRWNRIKTAKWLNISYRSLLYKLQEAQVGAIPREALGNALQAKDSLPTRIAELKNNRAMEIM